MKWYLQRAKLLNKTAMRRWAARILTALSTRSAAWAGYAAISAGAISHKVNLGYAAQVHTDATARRMSANPTTIYDNHDVAMPDNAYFGGNYDPLVTSRAVRRAGC